jgi:hypothetical protein
LYPKYTPKLLMGSFVQIMFSYLENSNENWKIIPQKYFENIGENFLIFNMNLDSFKSSENELTKNIAA